ncbi:NADP-dependent phosphogluconate dehydrogenase [Mesorhizobium sp. YIM 152430]|uniref:NADP-dependent phosphogluconate dehydrogenase n=1 Tax=Mesorhizobium sp. YIM 152430 TaxID=3031761 RepID=UPI0023DA51F8|nr:NADP-dependent phosphogluconate dehydrogenase [Mesorhizobium sp. YIM 152430]MDF1601067.1 NADP-dependent phosphogluconate dehydrogenase [Mesorhizobium sp. YIM 152430]
MTKAHIGLIGLGTMGSNLALNIAEKGHAVAVYNRTASKTGAFFENAANLRERIVPCATLAEFVAQIRPPRPVILMVQAGKAVDAQIAELREHLEAGDMIVDAGNANFRDTIRRFGELDGSGLTFVGMGVSGGEEGARHGPSIMVGGAEEAWRQIEPILTDIAARFQGEPCAAWLGEGGAGHFVKTIHNGIEYADMQMIAEIYGLLRDGAGLSAGEMASIFEQWNAGPLESYLVEITAEVLRASDAAMGGPLVDAILDRAGQKGTGRWAAVEAQLMGIPATTIETAVAARSLSADRELRLRAEGVYAKSLPTAPLVADDAFIRDLEHALLAAKLAAYAQGFAVMEEASTEFCWNLPLGTVARIWRAGCIIRSQFLGEIAAAYDEAKEPAHLLLMPAFIDTMTMASPALRRVVARAVEAGLPVPALAAAITYFDAFRQGRSTANLIQAQRDFFGAHGFERIDAPGEHHGGWSK